MGSSTLLDWRNLVQEGTLCFDDRDDDSYAPLFSYPSECSCVWCGANPRRRVEGDDDVSDMSGFCVNETFVDQFQAFFRRRGQGDADDQSLIACHRNDANDGGAESSSATMVSKPPPSSSSSNNTDEITSRADGNPLFWKQQRICAEQQPSDSATCLLGNWKNYGARCGWYRYEASRSNAQELTNLAKRAASHAPNPQRGEGRGRNDPPLEPFGLCFHPPFVDEILHPLFVGEAAKSVLWRPNVAQFWESLWDDTTAVVLDTNRQDDTLFVWDPTPNLMDARCGMKMGVTSEFETVDDESYQRYCEGPLQPGVLAPGSYNPFHNLRCKAMLVPDAKQTKNRSASNGNPPRPDHLQNFFQCLTPNQYWMLSYLLQQDSSTMTVNMEKSKTIPPVSMLFILPLLCVGVWWQRQRQQRLCNAKTKILSSFSNGYRDAGYRDAPIYSDDDSEYIDDSQDLLHLEIADFATPPSAGRGHR